MITEISPGKQTNLFSSLNTELMDAWKNGDRDALENLAENEFVFISSTIRDYHCQKEEWIDMLVNRFLLRDYSCHMIRVSVKDCTATCLSEISVLTNLNLSGTFNHYLVTDIWKCTDGVWRLLMRQTAALAEKRAITL